MYDITKIKKDAMTARANMERIGKSYATLANATGAHASEVDATAKDIAQLQADFDAIKDITKNSDGGGDEQHATNGANFDKPATPTGGKPLQ